MISKSIAPDVYVHITPSRAKSEYPMGRREGRHSADPASGWRGEVAVAKDLLLLPAISLTLIEDTLYTLGLDKGACI